MPSTTREFELGPGDTLILGPSRKMIRIDVMRSTTPNASKTVVHVPEDVDVEMFSRRD